MWICDLVNCYRLKSKWIRLVYCFLFYLVNQLCFFYQNFGLLGYLIYLFFGSSFQGQCYFMVPLVVACLILALFDIGIFKIVIIDPTFSCKNYPELMV